MACSCICSSMGTRQKHNKQNFFFCIFFFCSAGVFWATNANYKNCENEQIWFRKFLFVRFIWYISPNWVGSLWPSVDKPRSFLLLGNALKTMYLVIFRITLSYETSIFVTTTQDAEQIFFWKKWILSAYSNPSFIKGHGYLIILSLES